MMLQLDAGPMDNCTSKSYLLFIYILLKDI